ncbi:hypothetical protein OLMES_1005 [Oleiphilus messinensis]|uniref:NAD synthetase n=1 Tax=Oleiphilus messinensis TaxID=141451 RepID=A0A1Y0I3U9_9GAMM|nr:hypothetical protein [Oleiphilus messinensis]ARU55091.1 hypothetical protein OLMES_1005 [Oleiphilus messinensis]
MNKPVFFSQSINDSLKLSPENYGSPGLFASPTHDQILNAVDRVEALKGLRVVFFNGSNFNELRTHPALCRDVQRTVLIRIVDAQPKRSAIVNQQIAKTEDSAFYTELFNTSVSCGGAAISWIAFAGSLGAVPLSGGTSTAISVLTFAAGVSSSVQCVNSTVRLFNESDYGDSGFNSWLDSQDWYIHTMTALDVVAIAGGVAAVGATLKSIANLKKSGVRVLDILKTYSRPERKRITEEIIRSLHPGISNNALKAFISAGKYPKRFSGLEISRSVRVQISDALGAAFGFVGSATGGVVRDPSKITDVAIAIFEEFESY